MSARGRTRRRSHPHRATFLGLPLPWRRGGARGDAGSPFPPLEPLIDALREGAFMRLAKLRRAAASEETWQREYETWRDDAVHCDAVISAVYALTIPDWSQDERAEVISSDWSQGRTIAPPVPHDVREVLMLAGSAQYLLSKLSRCAGNAGHTPAEQWPHKRRRFKRQWLIVRLRVRREAPFARPWLRTTGPLGGPEA